MIPRWMTPIRCFIAFLGGWFWLPCHKCGRNFGGFECGGIDFTAHTSDGAYWIPCKWCVPKGTIIR